MAIKIQITCTNCNQSFTFVGGIPEPEVTIEDVKNCPYCGFSLKDMNLPDFHPEKSTLIRNYSWVAEYNQEPPNGRSKG